MSVCGSPEVTIIHGVCMYRLDYLPEIEVQGINLAMRCRIQQLHPLVCIIMHYHAFLRRCTVRCLCSRLVRGHVRVYSPHAPHSAMASR